MPKPGSTYGRSRNHIGQNWNRVKCHFSGSFGAVAEIWSASSRQVVGSVLHSSNEPDKLVQWLCHEDSTIKNHLAITILLSLFLPKRQLLQIPWHSAEHYLDSHNRSWILTNASLGLQISELMPLPERLCILATEVFLEPVLMFGAPRTRHYFNCCKC